MTPETGQSAVPDAGEVPVPLPEQPPGAYAVGMEVTPPEFTRPQEEAPLPVWEPYYGLRFGRGVRVTLTAAVLLLPALFLVMAVAMLLLGVDRWRAMAAVFLLPLVVLVPVAVRVWRDLWRPHR